MAVNRICKQCKATPKVKTIKCSCGNGSDWAYKVRVRLPDGKWKTKQVHDLRLARNIEHKYKTKIIEGDVFNLYEAPSIDFAWDYFLKWAKVNKRTWKDDLSRWRLYINPNLSGMKMDRITTKKVQEVLDRLQQTKTRRGNFYAPSTIRQVLALIKRIYNFAIKQGLFHGTNPCDKIEIQMQDNKVDNTLNNGQLKKLFNAIDEHPIELASLVLKFCLLSGRRRGEVLKLKWNDVNMETGLITFPGYTTKNKKMQTAPVNDSCLSILKDAQKYMNGSNLVFPSPTGKNEYWWIDAHWKKIKKRAGVSMRMHDLRHQFASFAASSGKVDLYTLQHLLGHRSSSMTQHYVHLINDALKRGADVADQMLEQGRGIS